MSKVIGIDLGTSNSCMAVVEAGEPVVIPNSEGGRTTPSYIAFAKDGERLVGTTAKRQAVTNPGNTIFSAKRLIGRKYEEVKTSVSTLPYATVSGKNGDVYIECKVGEETETFAPEQISSMLLAKLKTDAESYLGEEVTKAVITVPAYFNDAQRQATKDAGKIAGLEVLRIVNEPTAASLAYGLEKNDEETIAVYDLGGGTYDISILEIGDGVFEVKSTNGDTELGGDNWDELLIDYILTEFTEETGISLKDDTMALQRLKEEAEKTKVALSSSQSVDINLPFITADASGPKHLAITITRANFEQICSDLYDRTKVPFEKCLKDADLTGSEIDNLILVGGMTRSPRVVETAKSLTGQDPCQGVNPDEVVAIGAAIQGAILSGDESVTDVLLLDVTPLTLGIETAGAVSTPMIERNTTIPAKKSQIFSTYADNQPAVDIVILQGERAMAADNKKIGTFKLDGIPPSARGVPQIEVTFDIDANGILNVSAKDQGSGKDQSITISGSSGLDKEEVEKLREEAARHADADKEKREVIETSNQLENLIHQSERQLEEFKDKLSDDQKSQIVEAIDNAKAVPDESPVEEKKSVIEALNVAIQTIGQQMYQESDNPDTSSEETSSDSSDDDIIDAEIIDDE